MQGFLLGCTRLGGIFFFRDTGTVNINEIYGSISFYNTGDAEPLKAFLYDHTIQGITM